MTARETAIAALFTVLQTVDANAKRNSDIADIVAAGGYINLRDGDTDEEETEHSLSPLMYHYQHIAEIDVAVIGDDGDERDSNLDTLLALIGAAIDVDHTLAGAVEWAEVHTPQIDLEIVDGGQTYKSAIVPVRLYFSTPSALA